jgi:hypothetical protein
MEFSCFEDYSTSDLMMCLLITFKLITQMKNVSKMKRKKKKKRRMMLTKEI